MRRSWNRVACGRGIGMCGYTAVPEDGRICLYNLLVRLQISVPRIKLEASNIARRFIGVKGRESSIIVNFTPQKPKIGQRIGQLAGHAHRCSISHEVGSACVDIGQSSAPLTYLFSVYVWKCSANRLLGRWQTDWLTDWAHLLRVTSWQQWHTGLKTVRNCKDHKRRDGSRMKCTTSFRQNTPSAPGGFSTWPRVIWSHLRPSSTFATEREPLRIRVRGFTGRMSFLLATKHWSKDDDTPAILSRDFVAQHAQQHRKCDMPCRFARCNFVAWTEIDQLAYTAFSRQSYKEFLCNFVAKMRSMLIGQFDRMECCSNWKRSFATVEKLRDTLAILLRNEVARHNRAIKSHVWHRSYVFRLFVHWSVRLSRQILLSWYILYGLSNLPETYSEYSPAPTVDQVRFWGSKVKVTAFRRGGEDIHVDA